MLILIQGCVASVEAPDVLQGGTITSGVTRDQGGRSEGLVTNHFLFTVRTVQCLLSAYYTHCVSDLPSTLTDFLCHLNGLRGVKRCTETAVDGCTRYYLLNMHSKEHC